MNHLITNIPEYEQLIDSLVYEPDNDKFKIFIESASLANYFKGRTELFFIRKTKSLMLNGYLEKHFDVPTTFTGQWIYGSSSNFKLQLLLIMIYFGVNYSELSQEMIDEIQDMIPYVSFNKLQSCLFRTDSSKFGDGSSYRIKDTESISPDLMNLSGKFIGYLKKNGQLSEAVTFDSFIKRFFVFLSDKPYIKCLADITRNDIEQYIEFLSNTDYNGTTSNKSRNSFVYRNLRALYRFFDYLVDIQDSLRKQDIPRIGLFEKSDFPSPNRRGVKHLPYWADKLIIKRIRLMAEETNEELLDKTIMLLLYYTGVRGSDACTLEKDCLFEKLNTNWLRIFSNKTKKEYEIPINNELYRYLNACKNKKIGGTLIHPTTRRKTSFLLWKKDSFQTFRLKVDELVKRISNMVKYEAIRQGISIEDINSINITSHKFRHTVAIRLCRMGADPLLIAEMLGHKDLYMAQAYIQEDEEYITEVMDDVLEEEFLNMNRQAVILPSNFDSVSLSLYGSKSTIFGSKCRIKRYDGGWCVYEGETQPCGSSGENDCFLCPSLKPDFDDPNYSDRLRQLLNEHKELLDYNEELKYLGDAKREELIIARIQSFLKEMKENDKKNQE
jgi:integrase